MSGNFTHLKYDPEAYTQQVQRSTNQMLYRLDANYAVNCNKCVADDSHNTPTTNDSRAQQIDIDSVLRGYANIAAKSNNNLQQAQPNMKLNRDLQSCNSRLDPEYTRYTYPSYDIKGIATPDMRLSYPLHDPQCNIFENFQINTRLQAKDSHKAVWQTPMSQQNALPVEKQVRVANCNWKLNCEYAEYIPDNN